jgi:hypothetical protein
MSRAMNGVPALDKAAFGSGAMTVAFQKDRSGITFDQQGWKPISCETATASDPFSDYGVHVRQ